MTKRQQQFIETKNKLWEVGKEMIAERGYDQVKISDITKACGLSTGNFYHYFKSKDMLFDKVVERFFNEYRERFEAVLLTCKSREDLVKTLMPIYEKSMEEFGKLKGNIHWSIQASMHDGTLLALKPAIQSLIEKWDVENGADPEILPGQLLFGLYATIHSEAFIKINNSAITKCILDFIGRILD